MIGPNGAGKTTLFNLITGDLRADSGSIRVFGQELMGMPTRRRVAHGLARTYQILTLFPQETLVHNVALALIGGTRTGWVPWGAFSRRRALHDAAEAALEQVGLGGLGDRRVAQTAYGERRRLELAMALAQKPRVLLLDEPLAGLSAPERETVAARARAPAAGDHRRADRARHGHGARVRRADHLAEFRRRGARGHARGGDR